MRLTLASLADLYVFESSPLRHDLGALHVPFDDLVGVSTTESLLGSAVRRGENVALIGASGSGKSSVTAHVLGPLAEGVAPLFIPLAAMPAETINTPDRLADHLITTIASVAGSAADSLAAELAHETTTITRTHQVGGGFGWRWLRGEMAREVKRQTEIERRASVIDKTDALAGVLETVALQDLQPVLVFDDTDRWIKGVSVDLVDAFFGEGVRWMMELPAPIVAAVHTRYFETTPRRHLLQCLDTAIEIPRLDSVEAIGAILCRRIARKADIPNPNLAEVLAPGAAEAILGVYSEEGSLRRALRTCHTALREALSDGVSRLTAERITVAANAG